MAIVGESIEIMSEVSLCRDPKDNFLLALAKDSQANFLITGDADLLTLGSFSETKIITYHDFLEQMNP